MSALDPLYRGAGLLATPGGRNARLSVLLYHRVLRQPDPLRPQDFDAALFDAHMQAVSRVFCVLPLDEALVRLRAGTLPARALCLTFDDGYRDNFEIACPILRRHGLTATFFIASGFLGTGRMFHDTVVESLRRLPDGMVDLAWIGLGQIAIEGDPSRAASSTRIIDALKYLPADAQAAACERLAAMAPGELPTDLMMTAEQVRSLPALGMGVGAHTHLHPILTQVAPDVAWEQIRANRDVLAALLGAPPALFAYPNGKPQIDYRAEHVEMVKRAGFDGAVTVAFGTATRATDPFQIPRFVPWDRDPARLVLRVLSNALRYRDRRPDLMLR